MTALLLTGARLIDPASNTDATLDLRIEGGLVRQIAKNLKPNPGERVVDCRELLVTPGLIDPHVHLREPGGEHKETIATGLAAASEGGFSAVCCMPNTSPALDSAELVRFVTRRGLDAYEHRANHQHRWARVFSVACATLARKGVTPADIPSLVSAGAVGISDDGDCVEDQAVLAQVLRQCARLDRVFMQHCQDMSMTKGSVMHQGQVSVRLGLPGWPREAEEIVIARDIATNRDIGAHYHVQHISSAGSVDIVRNARRAGLPVSAEASPHHLLLTHDACDGYNTAAKMNPPLREQHDIDALREGVRDGTITVLATDHAPHSAEEKRKPFDQAPFGIVGLETALALYIEALVTSGVIHWPRLIEMMTLAPAQLCGLDAKGLGMLKVLGPADVTVIDPDAEWTIDDSTFAGKSRNSPFLGRTVRGRAVMTIVGGEVMLQRAERVEPATITRR